jgi:hypothetical protein
MDTISIDSAEDNEKTEKQVQKTSDTNVDELF